jgi:hypothetical protein
MAPKKKVAKFERSDLESKGRAALQELARGERDAGAKIGALSQSTVTIIEELLKIKVLMPSEADGAAGAQADGATGAQATGDDAAGALAAPRSFPTTKLVAPSKLATQPSRSSWRMWEREVFIWKTTHKSHENEALVSMLLTALHETEKEMIFSVNGKDKILTIELMMATLALSYEGDVFLERQRKLEEFRKCTRGRTNLSVFLPQWMRLRAQCVEMGLLTSETSEQDMWDLVRACNVSPSQHASLLHELTSRASLRKEVGLPEKSDHEKCAMMLSLLQELARSFEAAEEPRRGGREESEASKATSTTKWTKDDLALFSKGEAKGKSKGGQSDGGKNKGGSDKSSIKCYTCGKAGHMSAQCWSAQPGKGLKRSQKGKGKGKQGKGKQEGQGKAKARSKVNETMKCWTCSKEGHRAAECPEKPA